MSRRERPAPRLAESAPKPSRAPAAPAAQLTAASPDRNWERLFQGGSPAQRNDLLALARSQGMLYSVQLPAPVNPHQASGPDLLGQALAGRVDGFAPVYAEPVAVGDAELDPAQREAVARALATPDLCLIQGMPGTGKSRVIIEIIAQITAKGQRVLLVAPSSAALDRVLESLDGAKNVCGMRCLTHDESLESLPAKVQRFSYAAQERLLRTQSTARARARVEKSEQRRERLRSLGPAWQRLGDLANKLKLISDMEASLAKRRAEMANLVSAETADPASASAGSYAQKANELQRSHTRAAAEIEKAVADNRQRSAEVSARLREAEAQSAQLEPLVDARKRWRFWTAMWWRAWMHAGLRQEWNTAQELRHDLQKEFDRLVGNIHALQTEREQKNDAHQARQRELLDAEVEHRQQLLDEELNRLRREQAALLPAWHSAVAEIDGENCSPAECTPAAVAVAREAWRILGEQEAQAALLARQWADYLEKFPQAISTHLPMYLNLVAATLNGLASDKYFGEAGYNGTSSPGWFDYLLVDEAEQVTEAALLKLGRRSRRWILIGQPAAGLGEAQVNDTVDVRTPRRGDVAGPAPARFTAPFHQLWQHFHCDPHALPYRWVMEQDRLCCKMRPVLQDQLRFVETERVADSPDIELRILTLPQCEPCLAEILFPPAFTIVAAKQFIYRELQELAPEPDALAFHHVEFQDRLALTLGLGASVDEQIVPIEVGIREIVYPARETGWRTSRLEFDRQTGWHWERVLQWFAQRTGLRDPGRTARLEVCHRMEPALVEFTGSLFGLAVSKEICDVANETEPPAPAAVEFVPVPAAGSHEEYARDNSGARGATSFAAAFSLAHLSKRGGAGLELDVADPRQRDRLPSELRSTLPRQGCVNYSEAQAVVEALFTLAQQSAHSYNGFAGEHNGTPLTVAVVTLYPAQAELIRRLVAQAPVLANGPLKIEVGPPPSFLQREADIVLLSLTRSHTHRAVAYGSDPSALLVALTRARKRLVIFGDAGTLLRRSQWDGPLEHLDQDAARQEKQLVSRLVRYLDGIVQKRRSGQVRQEGRS